jgi:malonate transporter MadM subunit
LSDILDLLRELMIKNALLVAFVCVGATICFSNFLAAFVTRGRIHGTAIAVSLGLIMSYIGGMLTGGKNGLADVEIFAGLGLLGGNMLRDLAIVSTAFGVRFADLRKSGWVGLISLLTGTLLSFVSGVIVAIGFGYRDASSITTIGAGAMTYIVGPVTGTAVGASSEVIALSLATGIIKAICVMLATPILAKSIGLDNPRSAMIYGGIMGTNVGVMAGLAATDPKLIPYGAMTATFYTGLGCLVCPSVFYFAVKQFTLL